MIPLAQTGLGLLIVLFVAGILTSRALNSPLTTAIVPLSLCMSLFLLLIPGLTAYLFHLTMIQFFLVYLGGLILAGVLLFSRKALRAPYAPEYDREVGGRIEKCLLLVVVLGIAAVLFKIGCYQDGDAFEHLALVRRLMESPHIDFQNPHYRGAGAGTLYSFNLWHILVGFVSWAVRLDPRLVVIDAPGFFFPVAVLALYMFFRAFFPQGAVSLWSTLLAVLYYGFFQEESLDMWRKLLYPYVVSQLILYPVCAALFVEHFFSSSSKQSRLLSLCAFASLALLATHGFVFFLFMAFTIAAGMALVLSCEPRRRRVEFLRFGRWFLTVFLVNVPLAVFLFTKSFDKGSLANVGARIEDTISWGEGLYFLHPKFVFSPLVIVAIILLGVHLLTRRGRLLFWETFAITAMAVPMLFLLNPFSVPVLADFIHLNLVFRIPHFFELPSLLVVGFVTYRGLYGLKGFLAKYGRFRPKLRAPLPFLGMGFLCVVMVFLGGFSETKAVLAKIIPYDRYDKGFSLAGVHGFLREEVPPNSVILSDPYLSYHIPALSRHYVVAPNTHNPPGIDLEERYRDTIHFFLPHQSVDGMLRIAQKYGANYVVWNCSTYPSSELNLEGNPGIFEKIYQGPGYPNFRIPQCGKDNLNIYRIRFPEVSGREMIPVRRDAALSRFRGCCYQSPTPSSVLLKPLELALGRVTLGARSMVRFSPEPQVADGTEYVDEASGDAERSTVGPVFVWPHSPMVTMDIEFADLVTIDRIGLNIHVRSDYSMEIVEFYSSTDGISYELEKSHVNLGRMRPGIHRVEAGELSRLARKVRIVLSADGLSDFGASDLKILARTCPEG